MKDLTKEERLQQWNRILEELEQLRLENEKMRELLLWLHLRGGLGLVVHERIRNVLGDEN